MKNSNIDWSFGILCIKVHLDLTVHRLGLKSQIVVLQVEVGLVEVRILNVQSISS